MRAGVRSQAPESGPHATASTGAPERVRSRSGDLVFGRYRLERRLGASGRVWCARDASGARHVLKLGFRARQRREHAALTACAHPNVIAIREWLESDTAAGIVFEYLAGGDLVSLAGAHPRHWASALAGLVAALGHVHARGFVHRDVKARNVLLDEAGGIRLIDFGSALTIGSPWTAAGTTADARRPDRAAGPVVPDDDVYALAALIHELYLGRPPEPGAGGGAALDGVAEGRRLARLAAAALAPGPQVPLDAFADGIKLIEQQYGLKPK